MLRKQTFVYGFIVSIQLVQKNFLYSPDTDIYHIGMPLLEQTTEVYIQLHGRRKDFNRYLHVNKLVQSLHSDPDLAQIPLAHRASILQMVYITTGCDYISYFRGIGKVFFLNVLYQHAAFITAGSDPEGSLADTTIENTQMSLLAFVKLVGCAYFKKHLIGFKLDTPEALFLSVRADSQEEQHEQWLDIIRNTVWERTADESHYVPSYEALRLHWKRCTWISNYWRKAEDNEIDMPGE